MSEGDYPLSEEEPSIKIIRDDELVDMVGVSQEDGTIQQVKIISNDKGIKREKTWISDCAAFIHTETRSRVDTEFLIKGVGAQDKQDVQFTITAAEAVGYKKIQEKTINYLKS